MVETSRRGFLQGRHLSREISVIRPPGAHPSRFEDLCRDCEICRTTCPEQIINTDNGGRPKIDFSLGECTFCGTCAETCPTGALDLGRMDEWAWHASVGGSCLSMNGVECRACQDSCGPSAIRFRPRAGGCPEPQIELDTCTGCGACVSSCPVNAIEFGRRETEALEAVA